MGIMATQRSGMIDAVINSKSVTLSGEDDTVVIYNHLALCEE